MNKILKRIWMTTAILIIFMAVLSSVFRSLTPWAKQYKSDVEHHLSTLLGQEVSIQTMETGWYWFHPVLKLNQVTLGDNPKKSFHLSKLIVGINLFKSLWSWQIQPGILYIDNMHLTLREKSEHWIINGISTDALSSEEMTPEKNKQILTWLSQQERLIIKHVSAYFYFKDGGLIPVDWLNVSIINNGGHYKLKGNARLEQSFSTDFQLLGDGYFDPEHFEEIEGKFYFSAQNIEPTQWQSVFPKTIDHVDGGKANLQLWVDMRHGAVSSAQAQIKLENVTWHSLNNKQSIHSFFANLSWHPNDTGWQMHGDHIELHIDDFIWPENQVVVNYNKTQESYQFFVKNILIESLLADSIHWPKNIKNIVQLKPKGILKDTQIIMKRASFILPQIPTFSRSPSRALAVDPSKNKDDSSWVKSYEVHYLLTRFEHIGWNGNPQENIPEVRNLSGVINWQPEEGRLELDSVNTNMVFSGYPAQKFELLNGLFDWKELSDGLRVSIDQFVLSKPDLTLSAQGALDQVTKDSIGHTRLHVDFSGKDIQHWVPFLPKKMMKPKLYAWLKEDLKRIAEFNGKITLNGLIKDFPFDDNNGEFSIESHALGGEIYINHKWKMIKEIEALIQVKNRNLNIDITHADFQGVPVQQMNLRIDDIGKNKEMMVIKGVVQASLQKMINYVMASPLQNKLSLLNQLSLQGQALLNLNIQVPLYPENDDVLAQGELTFENNTLSVKHNFVSFILEDLTGKLFFNEEGVNNSLLQGAILDQPLSIKIQSVKNPIAATTINVDGSWTIDSLKSKFKWPILSVMNGSFLINTVLKLANKPSDPDIISFNSSLEGLAINLPPPLGKTRKESAPLTVSLELNSEQSIKLTSNYDNRLSADLLFKKINEVFDLDSGQLRLGGANAVNQKQNGLDIMGSLNGVDIQQWKDTIARFATGESNSVLLDKLRTMNVTLDKLSIFQQQFDNMAIKAQRLSSNDWTFNLQQKNIIADLTYQIKKNELSGHIQKLHLDKWGDSSVDHAVAKPKIHPAQIPNLNLRIDNLSLGQMQIGDVIIKSNSTPEQWKLNYCRIDSPEYQFTIQGNWTQKKNVNKTVLDVKLNINNLAKSLERWRINPVVRAKKGYLEFKGGWDNSIYNISFSSLSGTMFLQFKNGLITHLNKETEEKLDLGKLLSILSLQTIPRRLQLDFSDLAHQGYSFDIFQGNFKINKGIMSTQDSYLDGPVAYAKMKGNLDLVRRVYDLNLKISPHITASLPIVATIAGGPVAGVATWVATKIINQGMQKISAYSYKISGPWSQPVVQQLSIIKKRGETAQSVVRGRGPIKPSLNVD